MKNVFTSSIPKDIICPTLMRLAEEDERIVVLSSDVSVSTNIECFKERFPKRFFELGIAEQSTMSVAGGLATEGFIPVYVALAIFSCGMTWPQMRQICNSNLNVKIIGTHAGVDDGQDGSGHHATEDLAIARAIPRMSVLAPGDENEVAAAVEKMIEMDGPVYMRVARADTPIVHKSPTSFVIGKSEVIYDTGDDFAIIFEGGAFAQALKGWEQLSGHGRKGKLISIGTVKPIDSDRIKKTASQVKVIVTVENHSIVGGLFSSVSEVLADSVSSAITVPVGFQDVFLESGTPADIKMKYGLSGDQIFQRVESVLSVF